MKKRLGRELWWMTAPVVLLGGGAWWFNHRASLRAEQTKGPPRLSPLTWERVAVTPSDVAQGYKFAVKTQVKLWGEVEAPRPFYTFTPQYWIEPKTFHLEYRPRAAQQWKEARAAKDELPYSFLIADSGVTVRFRLSSVPHDAQEVRARGYFKISRSFQAPSSWAPTSGYFKTTENSKYKYRFWSVAAHAPFDIVVKRPDEPFPRPQVSRQAGFQFVEARWFSSTPRGNDILVRVRKQQMSGMNEQLNLSLLEFGLLDANGRRIRLFDNNGTGSEIWPAGFGMRNRSSLGAKLPIGDDVFNVVWTEAPRGGWKTVKTPISLHLRLSRENAWPLDINVRLKPEARDMAMYGQ